MESFSKFIEAVAHLIGVLVWPAVTVFLVYVFGPAIKAFLSNISEGTFKGFGLEASAKRAVANIEAAIQQKAADDSEATAPSSDPAREQQASVADMLTPEAVKQAFGKYIMWVDDEPEGNSYEMKALKELGYRIKTVDSSRSALEMLTDGPPFDLIISDLNRPEGQRAGFDLLSSIREIGVQVPFIIYTGSMNGNNRDAIRDKAKKLGAFGCTNNAGMLMRLVLAATRYASAFK